MASADFLQFVVTTSFFPVCKTSSGKRYNLRLVYLLYLRPEISCSIGLCSGLGTRPSQVRLHIQFLFVRPRLCPWTHFSASTSGFFQILPHDRHPCLRLTVPTAKSVVDFHHQVVTYAEHTSEWILNALRQRVSTFFTFGSCLVQQPLLV